MNSAHQDLEDRLRRVLSSAAGEMDVGDATWQGPRPGSRPSRHPRFMVGSAVALAGVAAVTILVVTVALTVGSRRHVGAPRSRTAGSSSSSITQSQSGAGPVVAASSVERTLLRQQVPPRPTAASCRAPTAAERAHALIGGADSAFFSCRLTLAGKPVRFYVQVIANGSFIAQQEGRGHDSIMGCCVAVSKP